MQSLFESKKTWSADRGFGLTHDCFLSTESPHFETNWNLACCSVRSSEAVSEYGPPRNRQGATGGIALVNIGPGGTRVRRAYEYLGRFSERFVFEVASSCRFSYRSALLEASLQHRGHILHLFEALEAVRWCHNSMPATQNLVRVGMMQSMSSNQQSR